MKILLGFVAGIVLTTIFFYFVENTKNIHVASAGEVQMNSPLDAGRKLTDEEKMKFKNDYRKHVENYANFRKGGVFRNDDIYTQVLWWDYNTFKTNINHFLEEEPTVDGVRLYFMMHSKNDVAHTSSRSNPGVKKDVSRQIDVFFVGTKDSAGIHVDVLSEKFLLFGGKSFNEGTLCPPPRDSCKALGASLLPQ